MVFDGKKRESVLTVEKPFPTDLINGSVRVTVGRGITRVLKTLSSAWQKEERMASFLRDR